MRRRHPNVLGRRVDADDLGPEPCHRLGQQAAAAADVEQPKPAQRTLAERVAVEARGDAIADEGDARGVERVQRPQGALLVPPPLGLGGETRDLVGVDRSGRRVACAGAGVLGHGCGSRGKRQG